MEHNLQPTSEVEIERIVLESAALGEAEAPSRILIAPWGEVRSTVGSFVLDEEAAAQTIAVFLAHATDVPIDYEHQTLGGQFSSPSGQAPAAGWIKGLLAVPPAQAGTPGMPEQAGLWAEVAWTEMAASQLRGRQYRYLSPVALVRREDRRMVALHSAALTNKPAIIGMRPVVNKGGAAGAGEGHGEVQITVYEDLRGLLGLEAAVSDESVVLAAAERVRDLQRDAAQRAAESRVAQAAAAGKLTAAQREWAMGLALRDPAAFEAWERVAPVVLTLGRIKAPTHRAVPNSHRRSVEEIARSEYQSNRALLESLCTEEAYVADAVRTAGCAPD